MRIKNYADFGDLQIDKQILEAFFKAGESMMHEARERAQKYKAKATKIHPQSLFTMIGWSGIWNSLNTVQKIKVFRFVYKVENASIINIK